MSVEAISRDERPAFMRAMLAAFQDDPVDEKIEFDAHTLEPDRSFVVREGGAIVATAATLTRTMTLPGGREEPVGAVSAVGVRPGHTRRGHMRALMRHQLDEIHERGEAIAALWASEGSLYGRYGYGSATRRLTYEVERAKFAFRDDVALPAGPARMLDAAEARPDVERAYERCRRPGTLNRNEDWWDRVFHDPEQHRDGLGARRAVVQYDAGGEPAGYALYAIKPGWSETGPQGEVHVRELLAATPEAHLGVWRFLLSIDLRRAVVWSAAPDNDPLVYAARNSDAVKRTLHTHGLWMRLVDARAALSARAYAAPLDVVIELEDDFCPWNTGRLRLTADGCEATDARPDLALATDALASAYLGAVPLTALGAAGRVRELTSGALAAASAAFGGFSEPYCPEHF